jgi:hypothetical protein
VKWINVKKKKPSDIESGSTFVEAINARYSSEVFVVLYDPYHDVFVAQDSCCNNRKTRPTDVTHWIPFREYPKSSYKFKDGKELIVEVDEE